MQCGMQREVYACSVHTARCKLCRGCACSVHSARCKLCSAERMCMQCTLTGRCELPNEMHNVICVHAVCAAGIESCSVVFNERCVCGMHGAGYELCIAVRCMHTLCTGGGVSRAVRYVHAVCAVGTECGTCCEVCACRVHTAMHKLCSAQVVRAVCAVQGATCAVQ